MRRKLTALLLIAALVLCSLPCVAFASGTTTVNGVDYDTTDYTAMTTFLLKDSATAGQKNWQVLGFTDAVDPAGWSGHGGSDRVTWNSASPKRLDSFLFDNEPVAGSLNLSGASSLFSFSCDYTSISGITLTGCSSLQYIDAKHAGALASIDASNCTSLYQLDCQYCTSLTSANVSGCSALANLYFSYSGLQTLNASGLASLKQLLSVNSPLTSVDISNDPALADAQFSGSSSLSSIAVSGVGTGVSGNVQLICNSCGLTSLDLTGSNIKVLTCESNPLSSLTIAGTNVQTVDVGNCHLTSITVGSSSQLKSLLCSNNNLSTLDVSGTASLTTLNTTGNPLTSVKANFNWSGVKSAVTLTAAGNGYVALQGNVMSFNAIATPKTGESFQSWTQAGSSVATTATYALTKGTDYNLAGAFSGAISLTPSISSRSIYTGGRITLTPSVAGGTWSFDSTLLSQSGNVFTGLKAGTAHVTYTVSGQTTSLDIVISQSSLPQTGQDFSPVLWLLVAGIATGMAALAITLIRRRRVRAK